MLKQKKFADAPNLEDLINIIKAVENVNQQLLIENKFLRDQLDQTKAGLFKLIEENSALHKELKNITVHDILNEFNTNEQQQPQFDDINNQQNDKLNKSKKYTKNGQLDWFFNSFKFLLNYFI